MPRKKRDLGTESELSERTPRKRGGVAVGAGRVQAAATVVVPREVVRNGIRRVAGAGEVSSADRSRRGGQASNESTAGAKLEKGIKLEKGAKVKKTVEGGSPPPPPALVLDGDGFAIPTMAAGGRGKEEKVEVYAADCRDALKKIREAKRGEVDLIFADPPFNWKRGYDAWNDDMPRREYLEFTQTWLDLCIGALRGLGALWVNIPDDSAAEIVMHLKGRGMLMRNWCIWHYRFGQNTTDKFINSKVHVLYFVKPGNANDWNGKGITWNPLEILELSDRASTYFDQRTLSKKDGMPPGHRVPMDVWYGPFMGRVQGNNTERRNYHDNQLPEAYLNRVIRATSNPGDLVMDPFLGSGTTGVMAHALKRRFIGIEYSLVNAKNAMDRIQRGPVRSFDAVTSSAIGRVRGVGEKGRAVMERVKGG